MNNQLQKSIRYFETYEDREKAFRESLFSLIPRKHLGPGVFWLDFSKINFKDRSSRVAYITGNPIDCLAFGDPGQVLRAACYRAGKEDKIFLKSVIDKFSLQDNLCQPIRTLSGGETVKLAIARSFIAAFYSDRLLIASPFTWLSGNNRKYFTELLEYYKALNIPVKIFALKGEDSDQEIETDIQSPGPKFSITLKNTSLDFRFFNNSENDVKVVFDDIEADLNSPCLIIGQNGQGKSLTAKVIAGAVNCKGTVILKTEKRTGRARLLMQNVILQTMSRSFNNLAFSDRLSLKKESFILYNRIISLYNNFYRQINTEEQYDLSKSNPDNSLLNIKVMLIATRLCKSPGAIILDEPDWGLSRNSCIAFVCSVIKVSHDSAVPVMIISHKPWWNKIATSVISVDKTDTIKKDSEKLFKIKLSILKVFI